MTELIQKNIVVDDGGANLSANKWLMYYCWDFLKNFVGMAANLQVIDESPNFALGPLALVDNEYFVIRVLGEGVGAFQWEAKFQAADNLNYLDVNEPSKNASDGLFIQLSPSGGWLGAGGVPGLGFGAAITLLNQLAYNGLTGAPPGHTCECFFWANGNRMIAVIDKDRDTTFLDGWYLGKIEPVEAIVDDPLPCILLTGKPSRSGAAGDWGSVGYGFQLDPSGGLVEAILDPVAYINPSTQPSLWSTKYIQVCIPVYCMTGGSEFFRGVLSTITAISSLADKATLANRYRICWNDLMFSWDGSVPV